MKNLIIAVLICCSAVAATAQETLSFGPVVGINFSTISDVKNSEFNTGFAAGGQLIYSNVNNWGVGGAILYSREGVDVQANGVEGATNLTYLRIPLKGYWFFRKNEDRFRPKIFVGPSIGILLDSDAKYGDTEIDIKDTYNTFDLGLMAGAGFNARIAEGTWFNFDAGYTYGLLDVADNTDGSNRNIGITAGVLFGF
ncbi:MAG: outer membrane beta-barrel protein [Bacteroidetes bacterium]|nr:outer membrane beta-barrel protein [Bacteroidota bacterium]